VKSLFGTDGIRGRAFEPPLDEDTIRRLGAALAASLAEECSKAHILLAGDTRISTVSLAEWLASSFQAAGGKVTWAGVLPTPAVSRLLRQGDCTAGVVISASHNPAHDNGIKILAPGGEKLADERERHLEVSIPDSPIEIGPGLPAIDTSLAERYLDLLVASHPTPNPLSKTRRPGHDHRLRAGRPQYQRGLRCHRTGQARTHGGRAWSPRGPRPRR